jgi:hypothetical protein
MPNPTVCDAAATFGGWYRCSFSDGCSIVLSPSCAQLQFTDPNGGVLKQVRCLSSNVLSEVTLLVNLSQMLRHATSATRPYLVAALRLRNAFVHPPCVLIWCCVFDCMCTCRVCLIVERACVPVSIFTRCCSVCSAELLPFMDNAIFRAPPQLCKVYWPATTSSPLVVTNADGSVTVTYIPANITSFAPAHRPHPDHAMASRAFVCTVQRKLLLPSAREICPLFDVIACSHMPHSYLLPGECRHIGTTRAPVAPIEPSVPLAFMCALLASDSQPQPSRDSVVAGDDDFLSDGRSSFAWQVGCLLHSNLRCCKADVSIRFRFRCFQSHALPQSCHTP